MSELMSGLIALLGAWLGYQAARSQTRDQLRATAIVDLAGLRNKLWAPTQHGEFLEHLDRVDAQLAITRVTPEGREAMRDIATACWRSSEIGAYEDDEGGIPTDLLAAYENLRAALTTQLSVPAWRARASRQHVAVMADEGRSLLGSRIMQRRLGMRATDDQG